MVTKRLEEERLAGTVGAGVGAGVFFTLRCKAKLWFDLQDDGCIGSPTRWKAGTKSKTQAMQKAWEGHVAEGWASNLLLALKWGQHASGQGHVQALCSASTAGAGAAAAAQAAGSLAIGSLGLRRRAGASCGHVF